jgi:DNA-binding LacI/PurR family transcriptional regulator
VVVGTSDADGPGRSTVVVNHQQGAYDVTTHLLNLGHATVHHISGPPEWNPSQLRIDGWRRALTDAGRPVPPPAAGDWTPRSGHHAAREILSDDVTALFVSSDAMAVGALAASRELGRRVPDDLSIAGFDDDPIAEFLDPPLTTVKFDAVKLGPVMVRLALEQLSSSIDPAPSVHLDVELVIRNSTGPCR